MCEECITPQSRRRIESLYWGCGCSAIRQFLTLAGVDRAIEETKREMK